MDSFEKLKVLDDYHTLQFVRARGITSRPVPLIMIYEVKYDPSGVVDKYKARCCVQGHSAHMKFGEHYWQTYSASPKMETSRILQCLVLLKGYSRFAFDI